MSLADLVWYLTESKGAVGRLRARSYDPKGGSSSRLKLDPIIGNLCSGADDFVTHDNEGLRCHASRDTNKWRRCDKAWAMLEPESKATLQEDHGEPPTGKRPLLTLATMRDRERREKASRKALSAWDGALALVVAGEERARTKEFDKVRRLAA